MTEQATVLSLVPDDRVIGPPTPREWHAIREVADSICKTEFVPKDLRNRPDAVLACILSGRELGIGPMQALQSISILDGKPNMSAELQRALVMRAGHRIKITKRSKTEATVWGRRSDNGEEDEVTYTIEDAVDAKLVDRIENGKAIARSPQGNPKAWEKFTRNMLVARATSELVSSLFPDVLSGISYTADELSDGREVNPEDVIEAEEVSPPAEPKDPRKAMYAAINAAIADKAISKQQAKEIIAAEFGGVTSTTDLTDAQLAKVPDLIKAVVSLAPWERLRHAVEAEWSPSEAETKEFGDAVEKRQNLLGYAAELAEQFELTEADLRDRCGFKSALEDLSLASIVKAVEALEESLDDGSGDDVTPLGEPLGDE